MKNIILCLICTMSICFSGVWISYDLKWKMDMDVLWGDEYVDNGAISIGYETSVKNFLLDYEDETNVDELVTSHLNFGASFDIMGARKNNISKQCRMINIYSKYIIPLKKNKNISFIWFSLGYSFPFGDFKDYLDAGNSYGFGLLHKERIGLYCIVSNLIYPEDDIYLDEFDIKVTRIGLSYHF